MRTSLNYNFNSSKFTAMLGTGGIGAGTFFKLNGNHTLGREESRSGHFLKRRDYCKLHIISHYVKILLGSDFRTIPIGKVGEDATGHRLIQEMKMVGLDTQYIEVCQGEHTLASFCYVYPDESGGNLTVDDSACQKVDSAFINKAIPEFLRYTSRGIALAVPEVPLEARSQLLELGTTHHFFRVAAYTSGELIPALEMGLMRRLDLCAINIDEAAALTGGDLKTLTPMAIVTAAIDKLHTINSELIISITAGRQGSWLWDGSSLHFLPAFPAESISTAGAGDAFLAGLITGMVASLSFIQTHELAAVVAALSVTSPHTIHPELNCQTIRNYVNQMHIPLSEPVIHLLSE